MVLQALAGPGEQAMSQRRFGRRYLALRLQTEALAHRLFVAAGGRPQRSAPHYFVLGSSSWFRGLYSDVREVRLPLEALPPETTSFTYLDSVSALALGIDLGVPPPPAEHRQRVYRLDEMDEIVSQYGMPEDDPGAGYTDHQKRPIEHYIEVQLWSDDPVHHLLPR